MKKFFYALTGVILSISLVGCGAERGSVNSVREERQEEELRREEREVEEEPKVEEELEVEEDSSTGGYSEGRFGDNMKTYFFDYTVNSAYLCEEYNGYQPANGNCILVAEVTIKNTYNESIEMYDTDFQVQWNSDGPDDYDFPITTYVDPVSDEQLESTYELSINEETTGLLVFEVPIGEKDFSISYLELFDDESEGDVYFVFFTPEMK